MISDSMIAHPMRIVSLDRRARRAGTAREVCAVLDEWAAMQPDRTISVITVAGAGLVLLFWFFDWLRPVLASDGQERTGE